MSPSSIPIPIPIPTAMDSVTQMALLKPQMNLNKNNNLLHNRHLGLGRGRVVIQLHHRIRNRRTNSVMPSLRCSTADHDDSIVLHVGGMMCEGCAANVKRILESRPQVSSATVNLTSEIAVVSAVSEEKTAPNWQKQLGEALAQHLTTCGFTSSLPVPAFSPTESR